MPEITAAMVKALRERSGLPMMDCKNALVETNGDAEQAMELLRKRGAAAAEKKAGRAMAEGRVAAFVDPEKQVAAIVEIQCETAPVSNNPEFRTLAEKIARHAALAGDADAATIGAEEFVDDPQHTIQDLVHDVLNRIRENMKVARATRAEGRTACYVHHNGRVAVMITYEGDGSEELLNDVCMHIAAMNPTALSRADVPPDLVAKEEEIAREQIRASGKPDNLVDKILTGKMNRWYGENVLLEQPFVKDDKQTVGKILDAGGVKLTSFTRWQVGEVPV